jgi:hypothetical protein
MENINLNYPKETVNTAIIDTIKIINHYRLDRKSYNGQNRIWLKIGYIDFALIPVDENNSTISMVVTKGGKVLSGQDASELTREFVYNLNMVLSGNVLITPEIMNKDPYKIPDQGALILNIIIIIAAVIAIFYGFSALIK